MSSSKVQIYICANQLKNVAGFGKGKSDPYCVVKCNGNLLGKTEVIKNNLSPSWITTFDFDHLQGEKAVLQIDIFDEISKGSDKPMGSASFDIEDTLNATGKTKEATLKQGGSLFCTIMKMSNFEQGILNLSLRAVKLKNQETLGISDPFYEIEAYTRNSHGPGDWYPIHRSEVVNNNLKPVWSPAGVPVEKLCAGDLKQLIRIQVYDYNKSGKHGRMGSVVTFTKELMTMEVTSQTLILLDLYKRPCGMLMVTAAQISGNDLDPNNPPPRFTTRNGVRCFNRDFFKWEKKYGPAKAKIRQPVIAYVSP